MSKPEQELGTPEMIMERLVRATSKEEVRAIRDEVLGAILSDEELIGRLDELTYFGRKDKDFMGLVGLLMTNPSGLKGARCKIASALGVSLEPADAVKENSPEKVMYSADYDCTTGYWTLVSPQGSAVINFYDYLGFNIDIIETSGGLAFTGGISSISSYTLGEIDGELGDFLREVIGGIDQGLALDHFFRIADNHDSTSHFQVTAKELAERSNGDGQVDQETEKPILTFTEEGARITIYKDDWTKVIEGSGRRPCPRIRVVYKIGDKEGGDTLVLTEDFELDNCPRFLRRSLERALSSVDLSEYFEPRKDEVFDEIQVAEFAPPLSSLEPERGAAPLLLTETPAEVLSDGLSVLAPERDPERMTRFFYDKDRGICILTLLGVNLEVEVSEEFEVADIASYPRIKIAGGNAVKFLNLEVGQEYAYGDGGFRHGIPEKLRMFFLRFQKSTGLGPGLLKPLLLQANGVEEIYPPSQVTGSALAQYVPLHEKWFLRYMNLEIEVYMFEGEIQIEASNVPLPGVCSGSSYLRTDLQSMPEFLKRYLWALFGSTGLTIDKMFEQVNHEQAAEYKHVDAPERLRRAGKFAFHHEGRLITLSAGRDNMRPHFLVEGFEEDILRYLLVEDLASASYGGLYSKLSGLQEPIIKALETAGLCVKDFFREGMPFSTRSRGRGRGLVY